MDENLRVRISDEIRNENLKWVFSIFFQFFYSISQSNYL